MEYDGHKITMLGIYHGLIVDGERVTLHRYVWEKANGKIPLKMVIHHVDGDRFNNRLENLELMTYFNHKRIHAGWLRDEGGWTHKPCPNCGLKPLSEFYKQGGGYQSKCKPCNLVHNAKYAEKHKEQIKKSKLRYWHRAKLGKPLTEHQLLVLEEVKTDKIVYRFGRYSINGLALRENTVKLLLERGEITEENIKRYEWVSTP